MRESIILFVTFGTSMAEDELLVTSTSSMKRWEGVGAIFRCLSSPVRLSIIELLHEKDRTVRELVDFLELSQPLVSQHLRVLRETNVVCGLRQGREVVYSLSDQRAFEVMLQVRFSSKPLRVTA